MVFGKDIFCKNTIESKKERVFLHRCFQFAHVTCCLDKLFGKKCEMFKNGAITLLAFHLVCQ